MGSIDVFLSHDWETSRFMKTLTLLLCFNSRAGAVAALCWAIGLAALKAWAAIGNGWNFTTYLVFFIFLLFWQRMKCRLFPTMVFLDKLCIHQEDDELKQKGILALEPLSVLPTSCWSCGPRGPSVAFGVPMRSAAS